MNRLNQVLFEGKIGKFELQGNAGKGIVIHERYFKDSNGNGEIEITEMPFVVYGRMAEILNDKIDRIIRIVGRLSVVDNSIAIVSEHIEILFQIPQ